MTIATIESIVAEGQVIADDVARRIAELWRHQSVIGPGGACTQAAERYLATGDHHEMGAPVGQAGNGTAMRTAALGLWYADDHEGLISDVAEISRLTHQDSRSVAGGVVVAMAANLHAASQSELSPRRFCDAIADSCAGINIELSELLRELPNRLGGASVLDFIAQSGQAEPEFERPIISPFVVPTVLASIYCLICNGNSWSAAVTTAVRMGGDVDTLGAIVGTIAGARDGYSAIPTHLAVTVKDSQYIQSLSARYQDAICKRRARQT